ncbi:hypothetical protein F5Y06DRAFT_282980 [Hypoxylon sp. FL0890]|nr:hypothetical protein F5Y06DRAFT_282980 [Hypoxylon sp. FL0890]
MWIGRSKAWLLSEFKGLYVPTEDLLILSSVLSLVVSAILEALLLFLLQDKSKRTKTWLRYTVYLILSANALLAFAAFIYASLSGVVPNKHSHQQELSFRAWYDAGHVPGFSDGRSPCERRMASRWPGLLISLFSTVLSVSAWLDFRDQDRQESEFSVLNEGSLSEKGLVSIEKACEL